MKFKINKMQVKHLLKQCDSKYDFEEIELEPVWETFREAEKFETQIRNKAYEQGYNIGKQDGYWEATEQERRIRMCGNPVFKCPLT